MCRFVMLLALVLPLLGHAEIYKWVDDKGQVNFSDTPQPGATSVNLPPLQSFQSQPNQDNGNNTTDTTSDARHYNSLQISKPVKDETVRDNDGKLDVVVSIYPPLLAGDKIRLMLDGQAVGEPQTSTALSLNNIDRGTHQIQAQVIDSQGNVLENSEAINFFMHRATVKPQPLLPINPPLIPIKPPAGK